MAAAGATSLRCEYFGTQYQIKVTFSQGLTWGWLASEVIRLHSISKRNGSSTIDPFFFILKEVRSRQRKFDFGEEITSESIKKMGQTGRGPSEQIIYIIVEGKMILRMSDAMLFKVFGYLANASSTPRATAALHLVSRRFRRLIQSDTFWKSVEIRYPWGGSGADGDEHEEWMHYRIESGIPYFNVQRIRWMANTSSRLKLFYGSIPAPLEVDGIDEDGDTSDRRYCSRKDVAMVLGSTGQQCAKYLFRSIATLIPRSARAHHLSTDIRTIVPRSRVVKVEPTPVLNDTATTEFTYDSLVHEDPGILIEETLISPSPTNDLSSFFSMLSSGSGSGSGTDSSPYGTGPDSFMRPSSKVIFRMRRVGDERLSFIQFDHDPKILSGIGRDEDERFRLTMAQLRERAAAFVFVLEYTPDAIEDFKARLTSLYNDYVSQRSYFMSDISRKSSRKSSSLSDSRWTEQSALSYRTPLLIFLSIVTTPAGGRVCDPRNHSTHIHITHTSTTVATAATAATVARDAVLYTKTIIQNLVLTDAFSSNRGWYVQPFDAFSTHEGGGRLKDGVYAGMNWLARAMQKVNSTSKT